VNIDAKIDAITKNILKQSLAQNSEQFCALKGELLDAPEYYIVATPGTSREDWDRKQFSAFIDPYVNQKKTLVAFLSGTEAAAFAVRQGCVLESGESLVVSTDNDAFARLAVSYVNQGLIDQIKIYARTPVGLVFTPSDFYREGQKDAFLSGNIPVAQRVFHGVEEVRNDLETYEARARRKLDKGARFENIHTLIQSLAQQNEIDPADLDQALDLASGYTRRFFVDIKTLDPSIEVMRKYLAYFGLEEYLYIFKADCKELIRYLSTHKIIDKFKLKSPPSASAERFKLEKVERGRDGTAYVYKVYLASNKGNSTQTVVSNPLKPPLVVGREYQLMKRDGRPRDEDALSQKITDASALPCESDLQALVKQLDDESQPKRSGKGAENQEPRCYEEIRKDDLIKYFRTKGMDGRSALAKYRDLEVEEDILDAFYKYIQKKKFGKLEVQGYTPRKLIQEMYMEPYEAFLSLVQLRADPQNTKQRLIYRERDPQYQKPGKSGKTGEGGK